jgi:hypothetical protein
MPEPETIIRHGLVENAAGQLKCPLCREPLTEIGMVHAVTDKADTIVLPGEVRSFHLPRPQFKGLHGITMGMWCKQEHHVFLSLVCADGYITVKTEWEETPDAR